MANLERDKILTEAMGECWHEFTIRRHAVMTSWLVCKCGALANDSNTDFSTWEGFGKLWDWAINQYWWGAFIEKHGKLDCNCGCNDGSIYLHFIKPTGPYNFPDEIYEFLKNRRSKC